MSSWTNHYSNSTQAHMQNNVGRQIEFKDGNGDVWNGIIQSVSNEQHYRVMVNHASIWEWYVLSDAVKFI